MALELSLSYSQEDDLKRLVIQDITGEYNAVNNTTGWDIGGAHANNPPYLDKVVYAKLIITDTNNDEVTIDIINDLGITFSDSTVIADLVYQIDNDDLGWDTDTEYPDGVYKIEYRVSNNLTWDTGGDDISLISYVGVYGQIERCILTAIRDIYLYYDNCNSKYLDDVFEMYTLFIQLKNAAFCGDITNFENILTKLTYLKRIRNINC